jgi:hypothetical protein
VELQEHIESGIFTHKKSRRVSSPDVDDGVMME